MCVRKNEALHILGLDAILV